MRRPKIALEAQQSPPSLEDAVRVRRAAVLKAARSVFEAKGLEDASIRLIAQAAGVTTGAIYPYFSGKEEIYAELLADSMDTLRMELERAVSAAAGARKRFRAVLESFFVYYEARPDDLALALYLFRGLRPQGLTPELNRRLNGKALEVLAVVKRCIEALGKLDGRDAELELGLHVSFLFGLLLIHHTKRSRLLGAETRALLTLHVEHATKRLAAASVDRRGMRR